MPTRKNRTPSKCKEWERERRNRFNNACNQLEALVIANEVCKDGDHTSNRIPNMAKVEVVLHAIVLIKHLLEIKSKLDDKLVLLQEQVTSLKAAENKKTDVAVQVNRLTSNVEKISRPKKVLWKEAIRKENVTTIKKNLGKENSGSVIITNKILPKLLPKASIEKKRKSDLVVLPASPYILPDRPVILPPVQQTFVLLESLLPTNRNTMPILPRLVTDITKTTMVNKIPITAFSFPVSISKNKKNNVSERKGKRCPKITKKNQKNASVIKSKSISSNTNNVVNNNCDNKNKENCEEKVSESNPQLSPGMTKEIKTTKSDNIVNVDSGKNDCLTTNANEATNIHKDNCEQLTTNSKSPSNRTDEIELEPNIENEKKVNKMQSILDTSMCESTVDGGNARLELAEELLAASPTAAFLMSFPLVSGIRAESPAEDEHNSTSNNVRPLTTNKQENCNVVNNHIETYFNKSNNIEKTQTQQNNMSSASNFNEKPKSNKHNQSRASTINSLSEATFLNMAPSGLAPLSSTTVANDSIFSLDLEGVISKNTTASTNSYVSSNLLFRNEPFSSKNNNLNMYSSSNLNIGHEYNNFGLYPCALEKYANTNKNKNDYNVIDDSSYSKINIGKMTYDFDLGLSQKSYEIINPVVNTTLAKDNVFTMATSVQNSSAYNPFNTDLHTSVNSTNTAGKKYNSNNSKINPFYSETITNFYSQPSTFWAEDINMYGNPSAHVSKNSKPEHHPPFNDQTITSNVKCNNDAKQYSNSSVHKSSKLEVNQLVSDKNNRKSPSKPHINWMTSEGRLQNNYTGFQYENKEIPKTPYNSITNTGTLPVIDYNLGKKQEFAENVFPIPMSSHINHEDIQLWPGARSIIPSDVTFEPTPINLPTLVGDLALGPQERRKSTDRINRGHTAQSEFTSGNNFLSVTQLMNRPMETPGRNQTHYGDYQKYPSIKNDNTIVTYGPTTAKTVVSYSESSSQPCYSFNNEKLSNISYNSNHSNKHKSQKSSERNKFHKNNYSAEALIKSGSNTHKVGDSKLVWNSTQKYSGYQQSGETQVAQVTHYPCIADYTDNSYTGSGFYTSSAPTSLYSTFTPAGGSGGAIVSSSYSGTFTPEFPDFASVPPMDCNYSYPIFDSFKTRNHIDPFAQAKTPLDLPKPKEILGKHKADFTKRDHSKKVTNKKLKTAAAEDWTESGDTLLNNRNTKKIAYMSSDEMPFVNYFTNQNPSHNNSIVSDMMGYAPPHSSGQPVLSSRPLNCPTNTSRTNFNLSTLFPEIAKVRQS